MCTDNSPYKNLPPVFGFNMPGTRMLAVYLALKYTHTAVPRAPDVGKLFSPCFVSWFPPRLKSYKVLLVIIPTNYTIPIKYKIKIPRSHQGHSVSNPPHSSSLRTTNPFVTPILPIPAKLTSRKQG